MSIDVYLQLPEFSTCENCGHKTEVGSSEVYSANYTHNIISIAKEVDLYYPIWRPEEMNPPIAYAKDLVSLLLSGIERMRTHKDSLVLLNPKNGWGSYETFLPWVEKYIQACQDYPEAVIRVRR